MKAATVVYLLAGAVTEAEHRGDRVTVQHHADGLAVVKVYRKGRFVEWASYRNAEQITRTAKARKNRPRKA